MNHVSKDEVALLFGGDVTGTGRTWDLVKQGRFDELWRDTRDLIQEYDYSICNLESPLIEGGKSIEKIGPNIRGPKELATFIKQWGFDAVGLANNHICDFGNEGVLSTVESCRHEGLACLGAGANLVEAERAQRVVIRGIKISILAVCEEEFCIADEESAGAAPMRPIALFYRIQEEKEWADHVLVYFHGGNEHYAYPRPGLQEECRFFIDAGCSAVIGCHSHVLGSYEVYNGAPIVYGLGNLLFDGNAAGQHKGKPRPWSEGYFLGLKLSKNSGLKFEFHFYEQFSAHGGVSLSDQSSRLLASERLEKLRFITEDRSLLMAKWSEFASDGRRVIAPMFHFSSNRVLRKILFWLIKLGFLPTQQWRLSILNRIRCASHHELSVKHLEDCNR